MARAQVGPVLPAGITKETTRHPPSQRHLPPQAGDDVEIHYTASLKPSGAVYDSSKERGQIFTHKIGQGQVIDGWDRALQTMRKGEHARFTISPEFAYGESGLCDDLENSESVQSASGSFKVPPNSTIVLEFELLKCPTREDLFEDGGAIKREMKEGKEHGRQPRVGDECQITYKITVEGCGVASAAQHGTYKIGSERLGQIARVIDKALTTMKRGDEAMITCSPGYAFSAGDVKFAGKVAMLSLVLEEVYECHDVSVGEKDKTVLRKRIKEGDKPDRIHDTAPVTVSVLGVTANGERVLDAPRELSFVAGDGEVCDALEGAVILLKEGEEALIRCESAEACTGGLLNLAPALDTPVMIHIKILRFGKVHEKWDMNGGERIARGEQRKEVAGKLFKNGRLRLACQHYESIADLFTKLDFFEADLRTRAAELRRVADLNRAMCMLKFGNMKMVESLCGGVLSEDPNNAKALYRRAKARLALKEYQPAIDDLQRLLDLEPNSADGRQLMREAKRFRKQNDEKQSLTYSKMVASLGGMPERTDRRDDDIVVMPDIEAESRAIRERFGLAPKTVLQASTPSSVVEPPPSKEAAEEGVLAASVEPTDETLMASTPSAAAEQRSAKE